MFQINCRTISRRREIVEKYELTPVGHYKLLKGEEKVSCTKNPLSHSYYIFTYKKKGTNEKRDCFICGKPTAEHFLNLIGKDSLSIFNPLMEESNSSSISTISKETHPSGNKTTEQLLNAINLIIIYWNVTPRDMLLDIKLKAEKNINKKISSSDIKSINTMLINTKLTMPKIIKSLKEKNPNLKEFEFELLVKELKNRGIGVDDICFK